MLRDGEVVELLQQLIRNQCVNYGSTESGHEGRSASLLEQALDGSGLSLEIYTPPEAPHRSSLVARLESIQGTGRRIALIGHTDVVPAIEESWIHDPFGGELIGNEIWGRGAVDMLNQTAAMAIAMKHLAQAGWRPHGEVMLLAVADEEGGGKYGCDWLLREHFDQVKADIVFTEMGGIQSAGGITVGTEEKGLAAINISVHGAGSHGSTPWEADNAIIRAAHVILALQRYRPRSHLGPTWHAWIEGQALDNSTRNKLLEGFNLWDLLPDLPIGLARRIHAASHTTISPNVISGGTLRNIIPEKVVISLDVRLSEGDTAERVCLDLKGLLAEFGTSIDLEIHHTWPGTRSEIYTETWKIMQQVVQGITGSSPLVPTPISAATDARFYRRLGVPAYGFGLLSPQLNVDEYWSRFHGANERIDTESLALSVELWERLLKALL